MDEDARAHIELLFNGYKRMKDENKLYCSEEIPLVVIKSYYSDVKKPSFAKIVDNFKKRYIYNESKMEDVHTPSEKEGLGLVYDYIQTKKDIDSINIYTLTDIHEILYSKTPHPEFGGKYRTDDAYLLGTSIDLTSHDLIVHEMNGLKDEMNDLVKEGLELGKSNNAEKIIPYIDKCIDLKCKLIKIHPFNDGNGRSIRAFINLLFRLANIPPVYIENIERTKYHEAMSKSIGDGITTGDLSDIKGFYYYKICDSIIELDVSVKNDSKSYVDAERVPKGNIKS